MRITVSRHGMCFWMVSVCNKEVTLKVGMENGKGKMGKQGIETLALGTTTQVVSCKIGQKSVHVVQSSLSILC